MEKIKEHPKGRITKLPKSAWADYEIIYGNAIVEIQGSKREAKQELKKLKNEKED